MTLDFQSFKQVIVQCTDVPSEDVTHPRREKRIEGGNWQALNQGRGQASEVGTQGGAEQADKPRVCWVDLSSSSQITIVSKADYVGHTGV